MVSMCVFCWDFVEGFGVVIDGFNVCVLLEFIERLGAEIDGFNVFVLLELSDSVYAGVVTACVVRVNAKMYDSLPTLRRLQRNSIRCRIVCCAAKL
jgi:hypothetical protein